EGWWYTARTPGGRTVAWLTDADLLRGHPWRTAAWFRSRAEATGHVRPLLAGHGYRLGEAPRCTSAGSGRLEPCGGPGWLAAGDAALAFDPLSSQGLLHALAGGTHAARAVADALGGDGAALQRYSAVLGEVWAAYAANRLDYYRMERRWAEAPFWSRR